MRWLRSRRRCPDGRMLVPDCLVLGLNMLKGQIATPVVFVEHLPAVITQVGRKAIARVSQHSRNMMESASTVMTVE